MTEKTIASDDLAPLPIHPGPRKKMPYIEYEVIDSYKGHRVVTLIGDEFHGMFDCWGFSENEIDQMVEMLQTVQSAIKSNKRKGRIKIQ